nr:hypothetical protein [Tanacetum cinerariifolium]
MSWTGVPEFADDTITDYTRPSPSVESNQNDLQNSSSSAFENGESNGSILSKPEIKFVRPADSPTVVKTDKRKLLGSLLLNMLNYIEKLQRVRSQFSGPRVPTVNRKFLTLNRKFPTVNRKFPIVNRKFSTADMGNKGTANNIDDKGYWDSGCSRTPRQHNMYSIDLNNVVPHKDLTCLVVKASPDESMLWHMRLGHLNFKTMNRLVRHNLVKGLPSKCFENDHTCTACLKGKQYKASCKSKLENSMSKPLHNLHMDLFGLTSDETSGILRNFIIKIENMKDLKVKIVSNAQDTCNADALKSSRNLNLTDTTTNPSADQIETLTVKTPIPTVSSPILTVCFEDSPEPSSTTRVISKKVTSQDVTPSLDNISTLANRFDDILEVTTSSVDSHGEEADVRNIETTITGSPTPTLRIHKDHLKSQIICPVDTPIQTRNKSKEMEEQSFIATIHQKTNPALLQFCLFSCFLSQNVWSLIDCPKGVRPIGTKWVLKNKKDERGIVIKNNARLVAQGHTQEEGIDYDEVFVPVDPEFPARVYKVEKAMYGLHQAPRAWFGTLSKYLLTNGFQRGTIDQTLFIRRQRGDFILVQVYVDDIIFGLSNPQLCREFEGLMHEKFQMSAMVLQKKDGIFLSQDKYVGDILNKFGYSNVRSANTPMDKENP